MELKHRIYVENGEPKLFVFPDSPCDWSAEPGELVDAPEGCTPETCGLHELEFDAATKTMRKKEITS